MCNRDSRGMWETLQVYIYFNWPIYIYRTNKPHAPAEGAFFPANTADGSLFFLHFMYLHTQINKEKKRYVSIKRSTLQRTKKSGDYERSERLNQQYKHGQT